MLRVHKLAVLLDTRVLEAVLVLAVKLAVAVIILVIKAVRSALLPAPLLHVLVGAQKVALLHDARVLEAEFVFAYVLDVAVFELVHAVQLLFRSGERGGPQPQQRGADHLGGVVGYLTALPRRHPRVARAPTAPN